MENFATIIYGAILIESIVNIIKNIKEKETSWKYWGALGLGVLTGVLVAYNWSIDLFSAVGMPEGKIPYVGAVLTGLILSRGSNVIHDIIGLINFPKNVED